MIDPEAGLVLNLYFHPVGKHFLLRITRTSGEVFDIPIERINQYEITRINLHPLMPASVPATAPDTTRPATLPHPQTRKAATEP